MDAIAEQQRDWAQTRSAVQALQNEYDAIFRGVTHR
jgi:DNA-binding ferritin-like protein (Dps family)